MEAADDQQSPRIRPLEVVRLALAFVLGNFRDLARWSFAPFAYGLIFQVLLPGAGGVEDAARPQVGVLLLLGFVLLWLRVPLELRLYRRALLGEAAGAFYGMELVARRTWRYLWAYLKATFLFVGAFGPAAVLLGALFASRPVAEFAQSLTPLAKDAMPVAAALVALAAVYVWLAPRMVTMFPEVALDGAGSLVTPGPAARRAARERWRVLGVMALIWTPEHTLNALSRIGDSLHWWDDPLVGWAFSLAHYVFGFLTLLVSAAAGAVMYARLSVDEAVSPS